MKTCVPQTLVKLVRVFASTLHFHLKTSLPSILDSSSTKCGHRYSSDLSNLDERQPFCGTEKNVVSLQRVETNSQRCGNRTSIEVHPNCENENNKIFLRISVIRRRAVLLCCPALFAPESPAGVAQVSEKQPEQNLWCPQWNLSNAKAAVTSLCRTTPRSRS